MENKTAAKKPHSITLENRKRAIMTGVEKVISSNENCIMLETSEGGLTIAGTGLKINKYDVESGQLTFEGVVNKMQYSAAKAPLLKRIFK